MWVRFPHGLLMTVVSLTSVSRNVGTKMQEEYDHDLDHDMECTNE